MSPNLLRRLHIDASSPYAFLPSSSVSSSARLSHTCLAPTWAAGSPVQYQCRSAPPEPQPRRSNSVTVVLRISVPSGRVTHSWLRRIGNCQQTSGFIVSGGTPSLRALLCSAQPTPPANPGRFKKMHAPLYLRVRCCGCPSCSSSSRQPLRPKPFSRNCQSSSV